MAKIKLGGLAQDVRGSQNGLTFSRNAGGAYVRAKASPVNVHSPQQTQAREFFGFNSKDWSAGLSDNNRADWNSWALTHPITDVFGDTLTLSGIASFQRLNRVIQQMGGTRISSPPISLNITQLESQTVTATVAAGVLDELLLTCTPTPLQANEELYVFATQPIPAGITNFRSLLRLVNRPTDTFAPGDDAVAAYNARFGTPSMSAGTRIGFLLSVANSATGAVSAGLQFKVICA